MSLEVDRLTDEGLAIERASFDASFRAVRRNTAVGIITGVVVVGGILLAADVPRLTVTLFCLANLLARLAAVLAAQWGLRQGTAEGRHKAIVVLEASLVPMGALSGGAPLLVDHPDDGVNPLWFGLLLCAASVAAANILIGHGRSRTFLAMVLPLAGLSALSAFLVGGTLGVLFGCGALVVAGILIANNREAGEVFRHAQRYHFQNQHLVEELSTANAKLLTLAHKDQLTGIANRAGLQDWVETQPSRAFSMAVVFVDLDGFKKINDEHGHNAGDQVLQEVARRLDHAVRSSDVVARFGGDEFIALIGVESKRDCGAVTERIAMCFLDPVDIGSATVNVEASIGLVLASPEDDLVAMVEHADLAMYDEKRERSQAVQS